MSKNCLKTQLIGTVNNNELLYFGSVTIDVFRSASPNYSKRNFTIALSDYSGATAKVVSGDIYFTDSTGSANYGDTIQLSTMHDLYVSNGDGKIVVDSKYKITNIVITVTADLRINLSSLDYIRPENGLSLSVSNTGIGILPKNTIFRLISCENSNCTGDLTGMDLSKVTALVIANTGISGNIEISQSMTQIRTNYADVSFNTSAVKTSNITRLNVISCGSVSGLISDCANGKLTELEIRNSGITGTVESYIEAEWSANRRSGRCDLIIGGKKTTFHEVKYETKQLFAFFDASSVTVRENSVSGTIVGTYDGNAWTY